MPSNRLAAYFADIGAYLREAADSPGGQAGLVAGTYAGFHLHSVFQPLFAAAALRPAAHEALLRVRDETGGEVPLAAVFATAEHRQEIVHLDRLCRTVHALNFVRQAPGGGDLFLNVHASHLLSITSHGQVFETLLGYCGLKPTQVVLEILEARIDDLGRLQDAVSAYRQRGYRVAIDDFGCQHSNFDRLWQLTPDIVKLDRSLIVQAMVNPRARRILPGLVDIIHDLGAQVVCEGIETRDQHVLARDAGVDLLQGYFYARPASLLHADRLEFQKKSSRRRTAFQAAA